MKKLIWPFVAVFLFIGAVGYYSRGSLTIPTKTKEVLPAKDESVVVISGKIVMVEVADNSVTRAKGLGGRESLGEERGMLFIFNDENVSPPFWMKDMRIAIDIIWINDGKVSQITKNVQPPPEGATTADLELHLPDDPIDYVLEVNAGYSDANEIKVGDTIDLSSTL